ncbi:tetratricopeptide repeat protein [bacterium]|jgi:tetratricopeptide (TPR) repeat protein|nr:tetratricopeptide repeat protein [bacterium]
MQTGLLVFFLAGLSYVAYAIFSGSPARVLYRKGLDYMKERRLIDAEHYFQEAVKTDPLFVPPTLELAQLYESQGMFEKAISCLNQALIAINDPFDEVSMETLMRIAQIHYASGRFREGWKNFMLLIKQGFQSGVMHFYLGELYMVQRRYGEATSYFDEALSLGETNPKIHYYRALCLIAMRERQDAINALKKIDREPELAPQVLFLLGKLYFDLNLIEDANLTLGKLLTEKNPIYLKDVLLFKGYTILKKDNPTEEELAKVIQFFTRGANLKVADSEVCKEFLFHLTGAHILLGHLQEAKAVLRDLCRMDSYYKHADQLYKIVSKPMLQREDKLELKERYQAFQKTMHFDHELTQTLHIEEFFPHNFPLIVLEKLEEQVQKEFLKMVGTDQKLMMKLQLDTPRTPNQLATCNHDVFLRVCSQISAKLGVVVAKNLSKMRNEAIFVGMDKEDVKVLVYFFKPASVLGTISIQDLIEKKDRYQAERLCVLCPGGFTDEAHEFAQKKGIHLYGKQELRKLM